MTAAGGRWDVLVVGGSLAGLQAALTLGRACRRVLVVDDGNPRNARAARVHNFLGQHDTTPGRLLDAGRTMLAAYDVRLEADRVTDAHRSDGGWTVTGRSGRVWSARAILLATGLTDELPDVPGLAGLWGTTVVSCPHCHGWEVRQKRLAQLSTPGAVARAAERAVLLSAWSRDVTLLTLGETVPDPQRERLTRAGVLVDPRPVEHLDANPTNPGVLITVATGATLSVRAVFVHPRQRQQTELGRLLGCRLRDAGPVHGCVDVDGSGRTTVPGVWAAGTTAQPALLGIGAAGHGSSVALAIHSDLLEQDLTAREPR